MLTAAEVVAAVGLARVRLPGGAAARGLRGDATGKSPTPYDYTPCFNSRVFDLSWKFYGRNWAAAAVERGGGQAGRTGPARRTGERWPTRFTRCALAGIWD